MLGQLRAPIWLTAVGLAVGCNAGDDSAPGPAAPITLQGSVEKGPFILGSSVEVALLDEVLAPTGLNFSTQTVNDAGEFSVSFAHDGAVSIESSGFYYNEVTGTLSGAPLTLRALDQPTASGVHTAHVNLVTHLAYARVKTLVLDGLPLADAVAQAETELRDALQVGPPTFDPNAAGVDMSVLGGDTDPNAYLLAVSAVIAEAAVAAGGPLDATLQELVNVLSIDLADDGQIDSAQADALLAAQQTLDPEDVMAKLAARIAAIGSSAAVPDINRVIDTDLDGIANADDNCRDSSNPRQDDLDSDGSGDACDEICGDGDLDFAEECDDASLNGAGQACLANCILNVCGDGDLGPSEACDDGGENGPNQHCLADCIGNVCGDGDEGPDEECDDGNTADDDHCGGCVVCDYCGWTRIYDGPTAGGDQLLGVGTDADGNVLAVGDYEGSGMRNAWIHKYDTSGTLLWEYEYTSVGQQEARSVAADPADASIALAGFSYDADGGQDGWIVKLDADGNELWTSRYTDHPCAWSTRVAVDSLSNVIVVGYTVACAPMTAFAWIRKYDPNGTELWTRTYGHPGSNGERAASAAIGPGDSVIVVGTENPAPGDNRGFVRKYDPDGMISWHHDFATGGGDAGPRDVAIDGLGDVLVIGGESGPSSLDWSVRKVSASGSPLWTKTFGDPVAHEFGRAVGVASDGRLFVGLSIGDNAHVMVLDQNAEPLVEFPFGASWATDIAVDSNDDFVVGGVAGGIWTGRLVKYTP